MSVLYEKGTPAWDIGMLLLWHAAGLPEHRGHVCPVVAYLREHTYDRDKAKVLQGALQVECDCGGYQGRMTSIK